MTTKSDQGTLRTVLAPVTTTTEEIPTLTEQERADFIDSLEAADARIEPGDCLAYDPDAFEDRLLDVDRTARRAPNV